MKFRVGTELKSKVVVTFCVLKEGKLGLLSENSAVKGSFETLKKEGFLIEKEGVTNEIVQGGVHYFFRTLKLPAHKILGSAQAVEMLRNDLAKLYDASLKEFSNVALDLSAVKQLSETYENTQEGVVRACVDGLHLGSYDFNVYKSKKEGKKLEEILLAGLDSSFSKIVEEEVLICEGNAFTKELANLPANVVNSDYILRFAQEKGKEYGFDVSALGEKELKEGGFGGILAVNQGSKNPPYLITCHYKPNKAKKRVLLVGKGVTFDTGGYSLKPATSMVGMKYDMHGCASVLGAVITAARLKLEVEVIAMMGVVENMISGEAMRPGDIIRHYNGVTVEINNTDAEGRLVLADVLSYGIKTHKPDVTVDLATLTGACKVALGTLAIGLMSNENLFTEKMLKAGQATGEVCWQLPMFDEYIEPMETNTPADLSNIGAPMEAGTITAAKFLERFVDGKPWIHLDIASTAMPVRSTGYRKNSSVSGVGPRLLTEFMESL